MAAAAEALQYVSPADRATRVRMGEALRDHWGDDAFETWDTWYQRHDRYTAAEAKSAWKSFGKGGGKRCTIATLIYEAKRGGWRQTSRHTERLDDAQRAEAEARRQARREADAKAEAEANAAAAARAAKIWAAAQPADDHPYLERKAVRSHGLRVAETWVKEWVDGDGVVHERAYKNALLVPIWAGPGRLASLQAIMPTRCIGAPPKNGEKDARRDKDYLRDGRKAGCYCPLGGITPDTHTVLVCEGYATGATLHETLGLPVMVAFDAGNLVPVARMLRDKLPGARIVVCADNDAFTRRPEGTPWNPGVECATAAAKDVAGVVATPRFASADGEPTDWNDLAAREGLDAVRQQFEVALNPPPAAKDEPADKDGVTDDELEKNGHFTVLGYDHDRYFIFQHERRQISVYSKGDFSDSGLIELAPLNWWEMNFPGTQGGIEKRMAMNWLLRLAGARGIYDISRIRGRGAWQDNGRMVYHHGGHLTVDGVPTEVTKITSRYVYELDRSLPEPAAEPMTGDEGELLLDVASRFRWSKPASAALLCGWVALAPLCGALKWRPHLWLTGGAGSGKAQPHSAKVLTPAGWTTMGAVRIGDVVSTPDNGVARIRGLYPQGVQPVYKLTFADGRTARATGDHLWKVRVKHAWRIRTTDEMREILGRDTRASVSLAIPLADAMTVKDGGKSIEALPLHPYVLGALLGDGSLGNGEGSSSIVFTSADQEIINRVAMLAPNDACLVPTGPSSRFSFRFKGLGEVGKSMRETIKDLRLLGTRSHDKFIPRAYLESSIENRVELLKGLMDTDGYVSEAGGMSYCTISPQLRDDVVELVRSLGGIAMVAEKATTYTHNGEKKSGQLAYNINIRLRDRAMAFHLERKVDRARQDYQYADCLYLNVASIEPDGEEECSCIAIDHPDRLYLTDNFVVTHNTTVLNDFVHYLMAGCDVFAQGSSSEAGIRQTLKADALPVLFDESEQNNEREQQRVQGILALIRQSSTESQARTLKGTAGGDSMSFHIRSMFCLSSIQVGINHQADVERMAVLALRPKREDPNPEKTWAHISGGLRMLASDETLPSRLLRRSLDLLPVTLQNIKVFCDAATRSFGSVRDGDQYGTMLAGAWSLTSDRVATQTEAEEMIAGYDWSEHRDSSDSDESERALAALLESHIRLQGGAEVTVYELVRSAAGLGNLGTEIKEVAADSVLQRYGMKVLRRAGAPRLVLSNGSQELRRLVAGSPFEADLRGLLLRLPGADRADNKPTRFNGVPSKCISLPLAGVLEESGGREESGAPQGEF